MYMHLKSEKGAALLDSIIAIAIFVVLFVGFFALMQVGVKTVTEHKARAGALAIARSQIEYVRSLDYVSVGLVGGSPSGNIEGTTADSLNNISYTMTTSITWYDDPEDGLAGADTNPNDYKSVSVVVTWLEHAGVTSSVALSTFVSDFIVE